MIHLTNALDTFERGWESCGKVKDACFEGMIAFPVYYTLRACSRPPLSIDKWVFLSSVLHAGTLRCSASYKAQKIWALVNIGLLWWSFGKLVFECNRRIPVEKQLRNLTGLKYAAAVVGGWVCLAGVIYLTHRLVQKINQEVWKRQDMIPGTWPQNGVSVTRDCPPAQKITQQILVCHIVIHVALASLSTHKLLHAFSALSYTYSSVICLTYLRWVKGTAITRIQPINQGARYGSERPVVRLEITRFFSFPPHKHEHTQNIISQQIPASMESLQHRFQNTVPTRVFMGGFNYVMLELPSLTPFTCSTCTKEIHTLPEWVEGTIGKDRVSLSITRE